MTNEEWFDAEIAPALLDLAKRCKERGISFLNIAEYAPNDTTRTRTLTTDASVGMKMVDVAMQAKGNVDSLMIALMRHAKKHGHSSIVLSQLGVPASPTETD